MHVHFILHIYVYILTEESLAALAARRALLVRAVQLYRQLVDEPSYDKDAVWLWQVCVYVCVCMSACVSYKYFDFSFWHAGTLFTLAGADGTEA